MKYDKTIALKTLEHMDPVQAKRCLEAPALWIQDGSYCNFKTGLG